MTEQPDNAPQPFGDPTSEAWSSLPFDQPASSAAEPAPGPGPAPSPLPAAEPAPLPYPESAAPWNPAPPPPEPYAQPGYPPQGWYAAPMVGAPPVTQSNGSALALLLVSIGSIVMCCSPLSIVSTVLGAVALSRQSSDPASSASLTKWGWISFAAGFIITILIGVVYFLFLARLGTGGTSFDSSL